MTPMEPQRTLAHYRLTEKIGAGGMGEVWRAFDTALERDVAVKILPEAFARDAERLARFEREAKAVAALDDPHILAIHGFGRDGDVAYAVTELLDGETLRQRLAAGPLPPRKAVELGQQIALGLATAHHKDFVHRDLKPENLFVTRSGRAKILDFGLATLSAAATDASTLATQAGLSAPGTIVGTAAYMSPEQIRGERVDARSDLFSLGVVLYEALTGTSPFRRDTAAESMTAILHEDVPERSPIPPALQRVLWRCLEKRPEERFQSARDLAFALETSLDTASGPAMAVAAARPRRGSQWAALTAVALAAAAFGWVLGTRGRATARAEPVRVRTFTFSGADSDPSASPDGRMIAFASERDGRSRIWIKQTAGGGEQPLTAGSDVLPRFSPDGSSVLFMRAEGDRQAVYRQSLVGGQPRKLVDDAAEATWSPDGEQLAFLRVARQTVGVELASVLGVADAQGGGSERLLAQSPHRLFGVCWVSDRIYAMQTTQTGNSPSYVLVSVPSSGGELELQQLGETASPVTGPVPSGSGAEILFARSGSLMGDQGNTLSRVVRFDLASGREETLFYAEHLFPYLGNRSNTLGPDVLAAGTLVFSAAPVRETLREIALDGGAGRLLTQGDGRDRQPAFSPDGKQLLFTSNRSGNLDLWLLELDTGALRQVTDDTAQDWDPGFTRDGQHILWSSNRGGHLEIWMAKTDGSGARQVTRDGLDAENPTMTPDGAWIVYWSGNPEQLGVWKIRPDGSEASRLVAGPYLGTEVSPDGRWTTFLSIEAHNLRSVIRVVDLASGEVAPFEIVIPVSYVREDVIFGRSRWLPDGRGIAFVAPDPEGRTGILAQDFDPARDTAATRRVLGGFAPDFITESFGLAPDGSRLCLAAITITRRIMIAEGVPGVVPRAPR